MLSVPFKVCNGTLVFLLFFFTNKTKDPSQAECAIPASDLIHLKSQVKKDPDQPDRVPFSSFPPTRVSTGMLFTSLLILENGECPIPFFKRSQNTTMDFLKRPTHEKISKIRPFQSNNFSKSGKKYFKKCMFLNAVNKIHVTHHCRYRSLKMSDIFMHGKRVTHPDNTNRCLLTLKFEGVKIRLRAYLSFKFTFFYLA